MIKTVNKLWVGRTQALFRNWIIPFSLLSWQLPLQIFSWDPFGGLNDYAFLPFFLSLSFLCFGLFTFSLLSCKRQDYLHMWLFILLITFWIFTPSKHLKILPGFFTLLCPKPLLRGVGGEKGPSKSFSWRYPSWKAKKD